MLPDHARRNIRVPRWLPYAAAAFCAVAGEFIAFQYGKPLLDRARASAHWPTITGRIECSRVIETNRNDETQYYPRIRYSYSVGDRQFEGKTVWVGDDYFYSSPAAPGDVVRRYRENSPVNVHYDPAHPEVAVLEPGLFFSNWSLTAAGLAFIGVGLVILLMTVRDSRKAASASPA